MTNNRIQNADLRRHGDHIGTLASTANATGDKSAGAMLTVASLFVHSIADARELEARVERLERELEDAARELAKSLGIAREKHIGILEVADGVRQLAAERGMELSATDSDDADFFDETADDYIEKAKHAPDRDHDRDAFLGLARLNRTAANAIRFVVGAGEVGDAEAHDGR